MDLPSVLARLNDLPTTFKRTGPPYTNMIDAFADALAIFTNGSDALAAQTLTISNAVDGWLDTWGLLFGVPRQTDEANATYLLRLERVTLAWVGTLPALQAWILFYAVGGSVSDNYPALGYSIQFPATMTTAGILSFCKAILRIRPAGVPFTMSQIGIGIYMGDASYLGSDDYLAATVVAVPYPLGPSTPNSVPLLPGLLFSDPSLNPIG